MYHSMPSNPEKPGLLLLTVGRYVIVFDCTFSKSMVWVRVSLSQNPFAKKRQIVIQLGIKPVVF